MIDNVKVAVANTTAQRTSTPLGRQVAVIGFVYLEVMMAWPFEPPDRGTERWLASIPVRLGGALNTASFLRAIGAGVTLVCPNSGDLLDLGIKMALSDLEIEWFPSTSASADWDRTSTAAPEAAISIALVNGEGERSFVSSRSLEALYRLPIPSGMDWIHLAGVSEARTLWPKLQACEAPLSVAGSWAPDDLKWLAGLGGRKLRLVVLNAQEARTIAPTVERAADVLRATAVNVVITNGGGRGVAWFGERRRSVEPAASAQPAVDTTGAGDAFCGGLIAGLSSGESAQTCLEWARCCASRVVAQYGGVIERSRFDELRAECSKNVSGQRENR